MENSLHLDAPKLKLLHLSTPKFSLEIIIMFLNDIIGLDGDRTGKNFVHHKQKLVFEDVEDQQGNKGPMKVWRVMDAPELSLGLPQFVAQEGADKSSVVTENNATRKRKQCWDSLNGELAAKHTSIELQAAGAPLPLDWEQCLDLESGKVYYLNRKTCKKSCSWPKDQKLDLELNISTFSVHVGRETTISEMNHSDKTVSSMVAVACQKCHLLVMLSRCSPSCPNCKHFHSFPTNASTGPNMPAMKSLETLSLLN